MLYHGILTAALKKDTLQVHTTTCMTSRALSWGEKANLKWLYGVISLYIKIDTLWQDLSDGELISDCHWGYDREGLIWMESSMFVRGDGTAL